MIPRQKNLGEATVAEGLWTASGSPLGQFPRYLVGGMAFGADFSLLFVLTSFAAVQYPISPAISFVAGLVSLCRARVFDRRKISNGAFEFTVFALAAADRPLRRVLV